jgi:uncharacterized protein YcfL
MKSSLFTVMICAVLLVGCQSRGEPKPSESCPGFGDAGSSSALEKAKVRYLDEPDVRVVEMRCVMTDNLLRVDADLLNERPREQSIAYRFEWFESNGMSIDNEEAWKPLLLYPDQLKTIRTVSPGGDAQDFRLVIKP